MIRSLSLLTSIVLIMYLSAPAQPISPEKIIPGKWIKSWLLCGPIPVKESTDPAESYNHLVGFTTDYLVTSGGEQNPQIKAGDVLKYPKGSAKWKLFTAPDSIIDLRKTLSRESPVFAYGYTEVISDEAKVIFLSLGTNDGGKLWVNGLNIWDNPTQRGCVPDGDLIPVSLKKGKNTLLLKVEQHGNKWEFCCRFLPFSTTSLAERGELFTISADETGEVIISSKFATPVLNDLIQKLDIEITNGQGQPVVTEQRTSDFCGKAKLDAKDYQLYHATFDARLKSGEIINRKFSFHAGKRTDYKLFSSGKSDYRIALGESASESERWAANELQHWLKEISGAELPIENLDQPHRGPQIVIGYNELIKIKTRSNAPADLDESFRYCNSGSDILIYGGKARGTMYGVLAYLENELGCRWYTPGVSVIPKRNELTFYCLDHSEKPGIRVRNDFYFEAFNINEALVEENRVIVEENRVIVVENATLTSENASLKARLALLEAQHTTAVRAYVPLDGDAWSNTN